MKQWPKHKHNYYWIFFSYLTIKGLQYSHMLQSKWCSRKIFNLFENNKTIILKSRHYSPYTNLYNFSCKNMLYARKYLDNTKHASYKIIYKILNGGVFVIFILIRYLRHNFKHTYYFFNFIFINIYKLLSNSCSYNLQPLKNSLFFIFTIRTVNSLCTFFDFEGLEKCITMINNSLLNYYNGQLWIFVACTL